MSPGRGRADHGGGERRPEVQPGGEDGPVHQPEGGQQEDDVAAREVRRHPHHLRPGRGGAVPAETLPGEVLGAV